MRINGTFHFTPNEVKCIDEAINLIEKIYPQVISADQLSEEVNLDIKKLQAGFKRKTGLTVHHYQLNVRIERAKADLADFDLPLKVITFRHGFKDASQFGKLFKKKTGQTPMEYRITILKLQGNLYK